MELPRWLSVLRIHLPNRIHRLDPWVGKILLEKEMATHSRILAWGIPWTEQPGGLQSMRSPTVKHNLVTQQRDMLRPPDCHLQRGETIFKV